MTKELVQIGHPVTSSNSQTQKETDAMGATAAIGSLKDVDFIASTFANADIVYCMVQPANYFDENLDLTGHYRRPGNNHEEAIKQSGVKRVINLSTIGVI